MARSSFTGAPEQPRDLVFGVGRGGLRRGFLLRGRLRRQREQIGDSLAVALATDRGGKHLRHDFGEGGLFLHFDKDRAADDDLAPRVAFAVFGLGLFERVETAFSSAMRFVTSLAMALP